MHTMSPTDSTPILVLHLRTLPREKMGHWLQVLLSGYSSWPLGTSAHKSNDKGIHKCKGVESETEPQVEFSPLEFQLAGSQRVRALTALPACLWPLVRESGKTVQWTVLPLGTPSMQQAPGTTTHISIVVNCAPGNV